MNRPCTLALGSPDTAFYRSLRRIMPVFGEVTFRHERTVEPPEGIVEIFRREGFHQVLMPNPYGNPQRLACYRVLRKAGLRVIASDRGALPDAWFFDHGFNQDSPSYEPAAWDRPLGDADRERVRRYVAELRSSSLALEAQGPRDGHDALRRQLGLDGRRLLFVPLQRPKDTVVRYFSGDLDGLPGLVELACELEGLLSARTGDPWTVLLKKHPLEDERIEPSNDRVRYVDDDVHVHDLLELADATLVLNSGVGLLSLMFGKPTLCAGEAFYAKPGLAEPVRNADEAAEKVLAATPPDPEKVERLVHHLTRRVYSFATLETELLRQKDGSRSRITRDMKFRELRILGDTVPVPGPHVLVVTPVVPWPIYRGSQSRIDTVIRSMIADRMRVSLCVLNMSFRRRDATVAAELRARYPEAEHIEVRMHPKLEKWPRRFGRTWMRALDLATGGVHEISSLETCPLNIRRATAQMCRELEPDFVLVNYAKMTPAVPEDYRGVKVIDTHDHQTRFLREDQTLNRIRRHIDLERFARSEEAALQRYDRIIAINPNEAKVIERLAPDARVCFVPAFSDPLPVPDEPLGCRHDALLVASVSNFNVKGLLWFLDDVLPLIRRSRPRFRLAVVGNIARSREIDAARYPEMELLGVVDDLREHYQRSRVVIAPLLGGAGMKIKVVEALGAGKAIVCTTPAAEGIALVHGESAWIADAPQSFAEGVVRLASDDALRRRVAAAGFALHAAQHSPDAIARALSDVFADGARVEQRSPLPSPPRPSLDRRRDQRYHALAPAPNREKPTMSNDRQDAARGQLRTVQTEWSKVAPYIRYRYQRALELLPADGTVLELGCGIGVGLAYLARMRPELFFVGVDMSPEAIDFGREHFGDIANLQLEALPTLEEIEDRMPTGVFLMALEVLEHLDDAQIEYFRRKIMRKVDAAVFSFPYAERNIAGTDHLQSFDIYDIFEMFPGFETLFIRRHSLKFIGYWRRTARSYLEEPLGVAREVDAIHRLANVGGPLRPAQPSAADASLAGSTPMPTREPGFDAERALRKLRKLGRDPRAFLRDSSVPTLRRVAALIAPRR